MPAPKRHEKYYWYKKSLIIYSGTVLFCERFLNKRDRTVDQMVQAARSGIVCANIMICLVNRCNFLLDRQIRRLERDFVKFGGLRERMSQSPLPRPLHVSETLVNIQNARFSTPCTPRVNDVTTYRMVIATDSEADKPRVKEILDFGQKFVGLKVN